ncbi:MAG: YncE family protein [Bifidobacterium sp.]|uniref:Cell surface protein n=2 Tax=Bifidobacterium TaxID=1678 RepID=A0A261GBK4_9BIFI|nr:YncE family protein [Bifidobacterium aquikefiri]OZG68808.1 cell surface protein [Bifidobacterium aquikefiri]
MNLMRSLRRVQMPVTIVLLMLLVVCMAPAAWGAGASASASPSSAAKLSVAASVPVGKHANAMLLAPDGKTLYVTNGNTDSGNADTTVTVIDMAAARATATIDTHVTNPTNPRISLDGRTLLVQSGLNTNQLVRIDTATDTVTASVQTTKLVYYAASPDARHVVGVFADETGHKVNRIAAIDTNATGSALQFKQLDGAFLTPVALSADGTSLYGALMATTTSQPRWVRIDTATGSVEQDYGTAPTDMDLIHGANTLASPDGGTLYLPVSKESTTSLLLVNAATGTVRHRLTIPLAATYLASTPDGTVILTADGQGKATLTDTANDKTTQVKSNVCANGYMCGLSPDGTVIYGSIADNFQLTATDTATGTVSTVKTDAAGSESIIISPDGSRIALNGGESIDIVNTGRTIDTSSKNSKSSASAKPTATPTHTAVQPLAWIQEHAAAGIGIILALIAILALPTLLILHTRRRAATPHHRH